MRVTTRIASTLLAALLAVASLVALAELALAAFGRAPWLVDWRAAETFGQEHSWDDAAVRLIAVALLAAGVVLVVAALRPRPPVTLESDASTEHVQLRIRTRSLEQLLDREIGRVDGVAGSTSHWDARSVTVRATTRRSHDGGIEERVRTRASGVLQRLGIERAVRVHVRSTALAPTAATGPHPARPTNLEEHPPSGVDVPTAEHMGADR